MDFRRAMDLGAVIHSYGGPFLFVWAWPQGEAAVAHYETLTLLGAVTLGLVVHALSPRVGRRLS